MNILQRIELEFNKTPSEIMQSLRISKGYYSMIKNDKVPISKKLAIKINQEFKFPLEELLMPPKVYDPLNKGLSPTGTCN